MRKKKKSPCRAHFLFLLPLMSFLNTKNIIIAHTMTSPNNTINITPPALIDSTMNTDNIISAANNMVNNIIFTNSFHNRKRKNRDFKMSPQKERALV